MRTQEWNALLTGLLAAPIPFAAHAETYLTETQAAAVLFPAIKMEPRWMNLTPEDLKAIKKAKNDDSGMKPRVRVFWGPNREAMFVDRVLGKHEVITYAVAINPDGSVKGIEIMDYQETYGDQIREPSWRKNFVGKTSKDPLTLEKDIPNISGATLSSKHVTNGVRRVLQTYELLKSKA
jgi:hypothetical protein